MLFLTDNRDIDGSAPLTYLTYLSWETTVIKRSLCSLLMAISMKCSLLLLNLNSAPMVISRSTTDEWPARAAR